eukprot:COSAG03_NODE_13482_length_501_cov_1.529851_1_plen_47_part_10
MGTARLPHESLDTLAFYGAESRHVVVQSLSLCLSVSLSVCLSVSLSL